jgi:hypothetical protein
MNKNTRIPPKLVTTKALAERWFCCVPTVRRRLQRLGVKPIRLTKRSLLFRAEDIEKIEAACQ